MRYSTARFACAMMMAIAYVISHGEKALTLGLESLTVEATPTALDSTTQGYTQIGALTFLSGFVLRSHDKRFGGLSGLTLDTTGTKLYTVSDEGHWFSAQLQHDVSGRLSGFTEWRRAPLLAPERQPAQGRFGDAEAVTRDLDGTFLVAFEQSPRIWRYPASPETFIASPRPVPIPQELRRAPENGGMEAITVLADGRLLILTEKFVNPDGSHKGWLIEAGQFSPVAYFASPGFSPTDLATLPEGDVLVLERRYSIFTGPGARLQRLSRPSLQAGAALRGEEIARLALPLTVDNFEGLAVHTNAQGDTMVYLLSDNNYQFLQRTLLLQFRLSPLSKTTAAKGHKMSP